MRFSTSSIFAAVFCTTAVTAQLAGLNKLANDITKLLSDVTAANAVAASADVLIVINDVTALGNGLGGIGGVGTGTTPAAGTAIVNQIVTTVCPALVSLESKIPSLPFPASLLAATVTTSVRAVIGTILAALRAIPTSASVDISPAVSCLNGVVSGATKRDTVEPIPVAFAA